MKKLIFPLIVLGCISATISCKKETVLTDQALNTVAVQSSTSDQLLKNNPDFGVAWTGSRLSTDDKVKLCNTAGVHYTRMTILLTQFNGKNSALETYTNKGIKVILNLNFERTKNPQPFTTNMVNYRNLLEKVLNKYASKITVAVIENEPTVDVFHKGNIDDYITELKNAVDVCKKHGVKVADGGIHVPLILEVKKGGKLSENAAQVKKLIAAYKTMGLSYVNVHTHGDGSSYPSKDLSAAADYLRNQTGKPVMSNEFSMGTKSSSLIKDMVAGYKQGNYMCALYYSSTTDRGVELNDGMKLNSVGSAFKNAIQ